ncbi:MAG: nucleotidyltransferase family protein [Oscillospiraceae bacterium]|jgi:hypothetical protein|nr:nucleotidyltransferase family protein [Oscillospiraceae bacterium]
MTKQEQNVIALLRRAIGQEAQLDAPDYVQILQIAKRHGVSNMLYYAAKSLPIDAQMLQALKKITYAAAARENIQSRELQALLIAFARENVSALPLKGSCIKHLYPSADMRYMSDTDLLIRPEQARAVRSCMEALGYRVEKFDAGSTDLYTSAHAMHYELHRCVADEGHSEETVRFLSSLLDIAQPGESALALSPEAHYAYILCHMIKHFIYGGTGMRSVLDVYICREKWKMDAAKREALLQKLGIASFEENVYNLALTWFAEGQADERLQEMGDYILHSGVFGTEPARVEDRLLMQKGSRKTYLLRRLFPNPSVMRREYPILKKLPVFLPFFWIWRVIAAGLLRRKKISAELRAVEQAQEEALQKRSAFYARCGL